VVCPPYDEDEKAPDDETTMVSVYLRNESRRGVEVEYFWSVRDSRGEEVAVVSPETSVFDSRGGGDNDNDNVDSRSGLGSDTWGRAIFAKRSSR
jgi:hypothetical protein